MASGQLPEETLLNGRYRIVRPLGRGGMGTVYLAEHLRLGAFLAVKEVRGHHDSDEELQVALQQFEHEARMLVRLHHPNLPRVTDAFVEDDRFYLVMEYIEGVTLEKLRAEAGGRPLDVGQVVAWSLQIADVLAYLHAQEPPIIFRDLKPSNVMVQPDGKVRLIDFGIARRFQPGLLQDTTMLGSVGYSPPEQFGRQQTDPRSDVYAFGATLHHLLTGRDPAVKPFLFPEARELNPAVSEPLSRLVQDCLSIEPDGRPSGFDEVVRRLQSVFQESKTAASTNTSGVARAPDPSPEGAPEAQREQVPDRAGNWEGLAFQARWLAPDPPSQNAPGAPDDPASDQGGSLATSPSLVASPGLSPSGSLIPLDELEPTGGAVGLDLKLWVIRPTEGEFRAAIERQDSIVLIKGARQMGKTSLLARGLQQAREAGARVVLTDFQTLNAGHLAAPDKLFLALAQGIADQLDIDVMPEEVWNERRGANMNLERYLRREVLGTFPEPLVWGLDEVDRLFSCDFASEVFGLFRSWHNRRSLDPTGPWSRLTLAIAYATEAHLFITDVNQSPFNVGTRLTLEDFTRDQVADLNARYGLPLHSPSEVERFCRLVGGQPYLVQRGLSALATTGTDIATFEGDADRDEGLFGDHLRRFLVVLTRDPELADVMRALLRGEPCRTDESFYRLRSAGLLTGDSRWDARPRCHIYATYMERHLL